MKQSVLKLLVSILLVSSLLACAKMPVMPDVTTCFVDIVNKQCHWFILPKERGIEPTYVESTPLTADMLSLDKGYWFAPPEYSKMEEYVDALIDWGKANCQ